MSAGDLEVVRSWFRSFERGDLGLELCDPQIEIRNWDEFPLTGPYVGHQGVRQWWRDISEVFEDLRWEPLELTDAGDGRIVTVQRFSGRFRLTDLETRFAWGSVITVRDGKIASARGYLTPRDAKRAAGLPADGDQA